ncbi:type I restriction endonuclease subunit R [Exiguobacterium sp. R-17]|uniref:type I restriction endonuclease subunit R n=1 Tax=Exiguobacterium sp. R-17 TaxID=3404054 RepID=UPI003CEFDD8E
MLKNPIQERSDYQRFIIDYLVENNGYAERKYSKSTYDQNKAMNQEELILFLKDTQPDEYQELYDYYGENTDNVIISTILKQIDSKNGMLLTVLKYGVDIDNTHFELMYRKPGNDFNRTWQEKYEKNRFTVMEEVYHKVGERIDLVLFLNGLPVITIELKANTSGQSYKHAIWQYRKERDYRTRLLRFKKGALVHFAMDFKEAYMCTELKGETSYFLPFNRGYNDGAGNKSNKDGFGVAYIWEEIFTKDMLLSLISKFIFLERKEDKIKKKVEEHLIFPRFHQQRAVQRVIEKMRTHGTNQNYLIQHSAGSGKTNTIAWLSHQLSQLIDEDGKAVVDSTIIITDRVVVDRQLQRAIQQIEHKAGLVRVMDNDATSQDLADALNGSYKIIVSTIHKFNYIVDNVRELEDKKFAVIIDEAHSSTSGRMMDGVTEVLSKKVQQISNENGEELDDQELVAAKIESDIEAHGKQKNVSMIAFTATPKPKTLKIFGEKGPDGHEKEFDLYSMKQAIEEKFILDVLENYTTFSTYYKVISKAIDDPSLEISQAKRAITRFISLHDVNITQKVEIIVEHFRENIQNMLGGQAKAMIVTSSREAAVKYYYAFDNYVKKRDYNNITPLVAFSGKFPLSDDKKVTESSINGFSEEELPKKFDTDAYQVLLVANKYQTGFDQPKLCAMYVDKKLSGVTAVQTLSRLNRTYPNKYTFVLDFANSYEDIKKAFSKYYTGTYLGNEVNPHDIFVIEEKIELRNILDYDDINNFNNLMYLNKRLKNDRQKVEYYLDRSVKRFNELQKEDKEEAILELKHFISFYNFLIQVTSFKNIDLHKKYNFIRFLLKEIDLLGANTGVDLNGKIDVEFEKPRMTDEVTDSYIRESQGELKLPGADIPKPYEPIIKKLSEIIEEFNLMHGTNFSSNIEIESVMHVKEILVKDEDLQRSAKVNSKNDFKLEYNRRIDDALIEGMERNQNFNNTLLSNDELKHSIFDLFMDEIYKRLNDFK